MNILTKHDGMHNTSLSKLRIYPAKFASKIVRLIPCAQAIKPPLQVTVTWFEVDVSFP